MKVVAQIAKNATLSVDQDIISRIDYGLFLLVSFKVGDTEKDARVMADKVLKMRIFPDLSGKTNLNISESNGTILSVSQFTLYGEFKGRRPSFTNVLPGKESSELFDIFNSELAKSIDVVTGVFGADMQITFTNVGPVTYILEANE